MARKVLADFRNLVEVDLTDAGNVTWSTDEIDRAIRRALFRYSDVRSQQAVATIAAAASREYSTSTLTGMLDVQKVWFPYKAADPVYPPNWVDFELWDDRSILYLKVDECPVVADDPLRVYYTLAHTIEGLDAAAAGTYHEADEELIVLGSTAFAAVQRTRYVVDTVNPSVATPDNWKLWGNARLREFEDGLKELRRRQVAAMDSRVGVDLDI